MAQLAVSLAGAAIGFALGGPTGAQIGWAAGSLIASGLGPGSQGPRLSDTKVQVSSYGAALGIVYGAYRKAGNVIWSTDLKEHESEEGGKGGGPSVTTYSYTVSCAVAICEGVQGSVRRIWADAKLVYDATGEGGGVTRAASSKFAEYFQFYPGSEDQMPDPTIEAHRGAGNVPGYRGTCYVVFTDLPLEDYGNRIPNFTFEVVNKPKEEQEIDVLSPLMIGPWDTNGPPSHSLGKTEYYVEGDPNTSSRYNTIEEAIARLQEVYGSNYVVYQGFYTGLREVPLEGHLNVFGGAQDINSYADGKGAYRVFIAYNVAAPSVVARSYSGVISGTNFTGFAYPEMYRAGYRYGLDTIYSLSTAGPGGVGHTGLVRGGNSLSVPDGFTQLEYDQYEYFVKGAEYWQNPEATPPGNPVVFYSPHRFVVAVRVPTPPPTTCPVGDPCELGRAQLPGDPRFCITCDGEITPNFEQQIINGVHRQLQAASGESIYGTYQTVPMGPVLAPDHPDYDNAAFWTAAAQAAGVEGTFPFQFPVAVFQVAGGSYTVDKVEAGSALLSDIVEDISLRAGLTAEQLNTTALTDVVAGFQIASQIPARNAITPLSQAFKFDAVESGGAIKFVKRGSTPVVRITRDHLGAGEETSADAFAEHTRSQETELPATVNVAYAAIVADYETGTQTARRRVTSSQQVLGVELPIVLTDQQASDIAAVLLYDLWTARTERRLQLTRYWSQLEPTDVIEFHDGQFAYQVRISDVESDGPVQKLIAHDSDPASYSPVTAPSVTQGGGSSMTFVGPTRVQLLDIPLLREQDNSYGIYGAASGFLDSWSGARLFRSADDGDSYSSVRDMTRRAVMGRAQDVLGVYLGGNTVDEVNVVTVRMASGTLEGITQAMLLNNGNVAVLGDEVIQFQRAEQVAQGTYRLTGLLRGRLGTEQHMGNHAVGDRFVLLTEATLYRLPDNPGSINTEQVYKAVSFGQALEDAVPVPVVNTGVSLKPLSPVHLSAIRLADGSYVVRWVRRTRFDGAWLPGIDVPLGESTEEYLVEVLDGDTVMSSKTVTAPIVTLGSSESSYTMDTVGDLGAPIWMAQQVGTGLIGLRVDNVDSNPKRVIRLDASGVLSEESSPMGQQVFQAVHGSNSVYVITTDPLNPTLYRFAYNNLAAPTATRTSNVASDFGGVAHDGANVWLAVRSTNQLLRLNPITLDVAGTFSFDWAGDSPNAIYADGGFLWAVVGADIVKWSLSTNAEVDRVTTNCTDLADIVLAPGLIFAVDSSSTPRVEVYDRATLTLQTVHAVAGLAPVYPGHYGRVFGDFVAIGDVQRVVNLFDAATGDLLGRAPITTSPRDVAGVFDGSLIVTGSPNNNYLNVTGGLYSVGEPSVAQDLTGKTVRVSQLSASVGPGFPSTVTIPAASENSRGLRERFTLTFPVIQAVPVNGGFVAIEDSNSFRGRSIARYNANGNRIGYGAVPPTPAIATDIVVVGSNVFVSTTNGTEPSWLFKYPAESIVPGAVLTNLDTAAYQATTSADLQQLATDGTNIWAPQFYTGNLKRLSAANLSVLDTYPVGGVGVVAAVYEPTEGVLYLLNSIEAEVQVFSIASATVVRTFAVQDGASSILFAGGLLYVASGVGHAYNAATGALVRDIGTVAGDSNGRLRGTPFVLYAGFVFYADWQNGRLVALTASTAVQSFTVDVPNIAELAGLGDGVLLVNTKIFGTAQPVTKAYAFT